ncbi:DUF3945 domain-containing protein [Flavobacterium sp. MFBS3-15]|uniref:DUF3945 domain-containing protein n=1 Tax=Flavobacterium sp. MFBS3-15 TaxID=2989816 RepID=UPI00223617E8|nr:DUF3945 domain-containing protein [Flavobacterium sp. MFBS3-15]MCW4470202.1 DUF3945 domain-containing protein [Flavobacterium sp. MFBS3-15]
MEDNQQIPGHPDELNEMLLVLDKKQNKMRAVTQLTKNGEVKAAEINDKNQPDFLRIERQGDFFSNFFGNFTRQLKEPTRFDFFRVPFSLGLEIARELQGYLNDLGADAQQLLSKYAINSEYQHKNHTTMETTEEYKFKPEQVNWESLNNLGLSRERLEKMNLIEPLLKGFKTNDLVPLTLTMGDAVAKLDARLSLQTNDAGQVVVAMHGIRKEPNLNYPFFGHEFSKEDKENLLKTGNMGRVVDLYNQKTSEFVPSVISVDRKTNELVAYKAEWMQIPDEIKGIKLDEQQKQALQEGKPLYLEGMTSKNGDPFDATVQFNADKRYVEFIFDRNQGQNQSQGKTYDEAPREFRGKELTEEQYSKFKEGMTVYITGLIDKNDKEYQGYITYNSESGKVGFSFNNPSKSKEEALPATSPQTSQNTAENKMDRDRNLTKEDDKKQQKENTADKQPDQEDAPTKKRGRKM